MDLLIFILIHFLVPLTGIQLFRLLKTRIQQEGLPPISNISLILVFISYGGWMLIILTQLFWYWSGMASLGLAYLIFIAPIVMIYLAWKSYAFRKQSSYHFGFFITCAGYFLIPTVRLWLHSIWNRN